MKRIISICLICLFASCFKEDEVYFDSDGNAINYEGTSSDKVLFEISSLDFDSLELKNTLDGIIYENGMMLLSGTFNNNRAFVIVADSNNRIITKVELNDVTRIQGIQKDEMGNIFLIANDSLVAFDSFGQQKWSKSVDEMLSNTTLKPQSTIQPKVLKLTDDGHLVIAIDCILSFSKRRVAMLKYDRNGNFICKNVIDSKNNLLRDAAKSNDKILLLTQKNIFPWDVKCKMDPEVKTESYEYFHYKNGQVYKIQRDFQQTKLCQILDDAHESGPPIVFNHEIEFNHSMDVTNEKGIVIIGSWNSSGFGEETILVEKFSENGQRKNIKEIDLNFSAKPGIIFQFANGEYDLVALKENKQIIRIRFNEDYLR